MLSPRTARAVDVTSVDQRPVTLDVTETSIVSQQFDARVDEGENIQDHGYGSWINRLNLALNWDKFTLGMRLDSSVYWRRPVDQDVCAPGETGACIAPNQLNNVVVDNSSRYRNYVYPAKIFAKYTSKSIEVTVGDAYVQFGRGLVLSLRKVDELGIDTTARGGKLTWTADPFSVTLVGGILNPTKIDEATGRALILSSEITPDPSRKIQGDTFGPQPVYGSDRVVGAMIQAGRGLPVVLSTHGARFTRCAPYHYNAEGRVEDGTFDTPFGSCDPADVAIWQPSTGKVTPTISATEIFMGGQSIEVPSLWKHGNLYLEAAVQKLSQFDNPKDNNASGNALYGALTTNFGAFTSTLEIKSYRNFYGVTGAVDQKRASAFSGVMYTNVPTVENATQDSAFGFFNACVNGGRLRTDYRLSPELLVYAQGIYSVSRTESGAGGCDEHGKTVVPAGAEVTTNTVWDGLAGFELLFDQDTSHLFASAGGRDDTKDTGDGFYYDEAHVEYTLSKHITGPYSVELTGRHRMRKEERQNIRVTAEGEEWWRQGEHYTALKIAPKWVFSQGIEYTTQIGFPTYYFNGSVLYRFSSESNIRIFGGQQRGGLKCVSGICKVFPAYSGARVELTVRF